MVLKGTDLTLEKNRGRISRQEKNANNMFGTLVSSRIWPEHRACKGDRWELRFKRQRGPGVESWGPGVRTDRFSKYESRMLSNI